MEGIAHIFNLPDIVTVFITCITFNIPVYVITGNQTWHANYIMTTVSPLDFEIYMVYNGGFLFQLTSKKINLCKNIFIPYKCALN